MLWFLLLIKSLIISSNFLNFKLILAIDKNVIKMITNFLNFKQYGF